MESKSVGVTCVRLCIVTVIGVSGCADDDGASPTVPEATVLVNQDVTVPAGGGSANVSFSGSSGQHIRMTLTASGAMEPYGYLTYPDGAGVYAPPNRMEQNGVNSSEVTLDQTGTYALKVFDGANRGGTVHVKVEVLRRPSRALG